MRTNLTKRMIFPAVAMLLCAFAGWGGADGSGRVAGDNKPSALGGLPADEAMRRLEGMNVFIEQDGLRSAVEQAFGTRADEGVARALETLKQPGRDGSGKPIPGMTEQHFVAKTILMAFPAAAASGIRSAYVSGDVRMRANLINASGTIPGVDITSLLVGALDDRTAFDDLDPERPGDPLRICDLAYNQLVLRFSIKGVLRTIGPALRTVDRDYHISILKERL